jgi:purine-binding chemotaxis protein CheW
MGILEIGRTFKIYPVHGAPPVIKGLINLRGKVITILDVRLALGLSPTEETEEGRMYILKNSNEINEVAPAGQAFETSSDNIGLHVIKMGDVITIENDELLPVPANLSHPYYKKVVRKEDGFIILLDLEKLLNLSESHEALT